MKLQLLELEEIRMNAYESSKIYKQKMKAYHDKKLQRQNFQPGQQVLLFNSRLRFISRKAEVKVVRAVCDQRSKTPWSYGIGGPYSRHS